MAKTPMAGLYDHKRWQKLPWYVCLPIKDGKNSYNTMGFFAIFYDHTNLPWEFLPSFMGKQTYHGSFCHLL
jgi:hypothetical protein